MSNNQNRNDSGSQDEANDSSGGTFEDVDFLREQLVQKENLAFIGQMTAGILHEIKNPLNFVNNFSRLSIELLEELKELEEKIATQLDQSSSDDLEDIISSLYANIKKILENGQRAERIILSMLGQARDSKTVEFAPTDINQLVDEFTKLGYQGMRGQDKNFNLSIKTEYDQTIGLVKVDAQDLSRVVLNIVNNACYTLNEKQLLQKEDFKPELIVSTKKNADSFSIIIKDNGMGMSNAVMEKIFKPFYTTKPNSEGTGLGLFMSYNIITKIHNGELDVESNEGEYTIFKITIPIV